METTILFQGRRYPVDVDCPEYIDGETLSDSGRSYVTAILTSTEQALDLATSALLDRYNENWIDENHLTLTAAAFREKLSLDLIRIYDEPGFADLCFDDGDMFGGHGVTVEFTGITPSCAQLSG